MAEVVIVFVIVAAAIVIVGKSFYRNMTYRNDGCGCGGNCHGCICEDFAKADPIKDADK